MSETLTNQPFSKKNLLARLMDWTGLLRLLELAPAKPQLIVINYHRIGDRSTTPFDPGVFSVSTAGFDEQLRFLKSRYKFATHKQALDIIEQREALAETLLLITFDDGYRDNFTEALPVLKAHGIEAIFFLVTSYIEDKIVPWWDEIAFLAKKHAPNLLQLSYPHPNTFDLSPEKFNGELRRLLNVFKSPENKEPELFLSALEQAVGYARKDIHADLIMTWADVRAIKNSGMGVGLHTHTHRLLSKLSPSEQEQELKTCKQMLECELGEEIVFLAYPVGAKTAFNEDTKAIAKQIGIRGAFSFYGGSNLSGHIPPFDIKRVAFDNYTPLSRARLAVASMAISGSTWI